MPDNDAVNRELLAAIDDKRMLVLATVVRAAEGAAAQVGQKLLVDEDQRVAGSLGDGELDARTIADALAAVEERKSRVASYTPGNGAGSSAAAVDVFLEVVEPQPTLVVVGAG